MNTESFPPEDPDWNAHGSVRGRGGRDQDAKVQASTSLSSKFIQFNHFHQRTPHTNITVTAIPSKVLFVRRHGEHGEQNGEQWSSF